MKAHYNRDSYVQMSLRDFVRLFPSAAKAIEDNSPVPLMELLRDPEYIIRCNDGRIEIGYTADAWSIG